MSVDMCRRYPVMTFASGPTNSMRGAAFLSGLDDCVVVDIGGTTTDVGVVVNGFPRVAGGPVELAGVRTNFRMPDVYSIGIGGGSLVTGTGPGVRVGPASVGHRLTTQARVFGGDVLTASDVAVAAGRAKMGDDARLGDLPPALVTGAVADIETRVAAAVDRMRTSADPLPWVLVGGGSVLLGGYRPELDPVLRPEHFEVANAVGAAIAQVGAELDTVVAMPTAERPRRLAPWTAQVSRRAVAAGAAQETVRIVEIDELPITYLPGARVRVRVKAVGDLAELIGPDDRARSTSEVVSQGA